jgi:two-component system, chemotaxis family, CheB/CheR fusion protein
MSKKQTQPSTEQHNKRSFPIVAIGASAGGVEAASDLFEALSSQTNMAYIYIQHTDPRFKSQLSEVISKKTKMKVTEAKHLMPVEPNHVYIIPAAREMILVNGVLAFSSRTEKGNNHMPIDHFMVDLADKQQEAAIGIVLSGANSDGSLGLKAIKTAGGLTFVQDDSAQFQSMPKSAIAEGVVDMVLSPKEIAKELDRLGQQADIFLEAMNETSESSIRNDDEDLMALLQLLKKSTGVDFTHYKMNTIKRRIIRRMLLYKLGSLKEYVQYLKQHLNEVNVLYNDLLINVTTFFRDPDTMEFLKKTIVPKIIKSGSPSDPIRIWVPACSTGEEAYSIAMIFMEVLGDRAANTAIQIFATDLSELAITKARLGLYTRNDVTDISPRRLQRFFTNIDGGYRIVKSIRDLCVFAPHNIFKDPPFSRIDLISCCNLMIYLDTVLQKKLLSTFHYALNPDRYLILGKSETIGTSLQLFGQIEKKFKIYNKKNDVRHRPLFDMTYRVPEHEKPGFMPLRKPAPKPTDTTTDLEKSVDQILLDKYVPASVVVNQELEILQFRGSTGLFLEPSPGKASLNLLKMARPGLAFELRNTVHKTMKSGQPVKKTGLEIEVNKSAHQVSIEVVPLKGEVDERLFLVVFEKTDLPELTELKAAHSKDKLVKQLEEELKAAREDMRSIIEEQEASNEELQSANEEIVSSNEELQSINEELETSKEELESTNEELMTINAELQIRNEQLAEAYEYAEAVFSTIREAILVLDKDLRVKTANKSFYHIFGLRPDDIEGLLIYELNNRQWDIPKLRELLEQLLPKQQNIMAYEITHNFSNLGEKVLLINACRLVQKIHQQQLSLLAIEDLSDIRQKLAKS